MSPMTRIIFWWIEMALLLRLPKYNNYEQSVDRDRLVQLFPESLFATTLQFDPTLEVMEIRNPQVTPTTLNYLATVVSTGTLPPLPADIDPRILERYFLIRVFGVVSEQNYNFLIKGRGINLLDVVSLQQPNTYYQLLMDGFALNMPSLLAYLLDVVPPETNSVAEQKAFIGSILTQNLPLFRRLLPRIDPTSSYLTLDEYHYVTQMKQRRDEEQQFFRDLYDTFHNQALYYASGIGNAEMVSRLLEVPAIHTSQNNRYLSLQQAMKRSHSKVARLLIPTHWRYIPLYFNDIARMIAQSGDQELLTQLQLSIDDDRFQPETTNFDSIISLAQGYVMNADTKAVQQLLATPYPAGNNVRLAREILYVVAKYGNLELMRLILAYPEITIDWISNALAYATMNDDLDMVRLILSDPRTGPEQVATALQHAYVNENESMLRMLMQDPRIDYTRPVGGAVPTYFIGTGNKFRALRILLEDPRFDPSIQDNVAIKEASRYGYLETMRVLLEDKRVDPSAEDNKAVISAYDHGHLDAVRLLLTDPRVTTKLQQMRNDPRIMLRADQRALRLKYDRILQLVPPQLLPR